MELHILNNVRNICKLNAALFLPSGKAHPEDIRDVRVLAKTINDNAESLLPAGQFVMAGQLHALSLINEMLHLVCRSFYRQKNPAAFTDALRSAENALGLQAIDALLADFCREFPPAAVYRKEASIAEFLSGNTDGVFNKALILEEWVLLHIAVENPACSPFLFLFGDAELAKNPDYDALWVLLQSFFKTQPLFGPNHTDLITMLREPAKASPNSLKGQLDYIARNWQSLIEIEKEIARLLSGMDIIAEEEKPAWIGGPGFAPPPMQAYSYDSLLHEYERFSSDREWMPRVVLMAKTVLVWLDQLSKKYGRPVRRLDEIPDEELNALASRGFTGIWLIGIWKRSWASKRIKQINGNAEAAASAYSLYDYDIADELGGWEALNDLRARLQQRGIRLAADMVPNHTGMDSRWIVEKPELFMQRKDCPFPTYSFNGENLSLDGRVGIFLEDHYYSKTDCAVVFKRVDMQTQDVRYIYHGNDGTGMPWNDTAQIDFLNPAAREEVIQKILHVARNFPIIRFDAAMVLAKKHIRRLWYPEAGHGGDIAGRAEYAMSNEDFEKAIPNEFWREVVDRVVLEVSDTLLLAEAFWMMEGYFVRTLGMHRVYNSAFMNMLKKEENFKYRSTIKNTLEFDPQVLKRFVNFMNNPDEETAAVQFGTGDKYFGVCTLMVTMPGLPMFGHGQIEGFTEKYGMEFTRAQWDERDNPDLIGRHEREIFPLMKKRALFADVEHFRLYDVYNEGAVNENVFAYTNLEGSEKAAVFYNNAYERAAGRVKVSCPFAVKEGGNVQMKTEDFAPALGLTNDRNFYCIFQEQKSGLWFIRSNADLFENGMFVQLNGYECQVLLNIYEVCDKAPPSGRNDAPYALLCERLGGKGTESMDDALKDAAFEELYGAFAAFASKDLFAAIAARCLPGLQPKGDLQSAPPLPLSDVLERHKEAAFAYFTVLRKFLGDQTENISGGAQKGTKAAVSKVPGGVNDSVVEPTAERHALESAWTTFTARTEKLVSLCESAQKAGSRGGKGGAAGVHSLYETLARQAFMPQILTAFFILYALHELMPDARAETINRQIALWRLDLKAARLLKSYGYDSDSLYGALAAMQELNVLCETVAGDTEKKRARKNTAGGAAAAVGGGVKTAGAKKSIAAFFARLIKSERAPLILGANLFENVIWFNREKALEAVQDAALLYAVLYAEKPSFACIEKTVQKVSAVVEKSGYKAEVLIDLLKQDAED